MSIIRSTNTSVDGKAVVGKGVNFAPVWETPAGLITVVDEMSAVQIALRAVDSGDTVIYTLASGTLPPGVFLTTNGILEGAAPMVDADRDWTFSVQAADIEGMASVRTFSLRVRDIPIPPRFVTDAGRILEVDEGTEFSVAVEAADDHTVASIALVSGVLPPGASLDTASGVISGTAPLVSVNMDYTFVLQATDDDGLQSTREFSIRVLNLNSPPLITTPAGLLGMFNESDAISIRIFANDDNGGLAWASSGGLPSGLSIDGGGVISGIAQRVTSDTTFNFEVSVTDSGGLIDRREFSLIIRDTNRPPVWRLGAGRIGEFDSGATINIDLSASDDEAGVDHAITDGELPLGISLTPEGLLTGTLPRLSLPAEYAFQMVATDAGDFTATIAHSFLVRRFNSAPIWVTPPGNLSEIGGGQPTEIALEIEDEEPEKVIFSLVGGSLPTGMFLMPQGIITGNAPVVTGTRSFGFTVRAADLEGTFSERSFNLLVSPVVNLPPVWSYPPGRWFGVNLSEGSPFNATLLATDPEGGSITYAMLSGSLPQGITFNAATNSFNGFAPYVREDTGGFWAGVRATDAAGRFTNATIRFVIRNDAPPPTWITNGDLGNVPEGSTYARTLLASFMGGSGVYNVVRGSLPIGSSLTSDGVLSGVMAPVGTIDQRYNFLVRATDSVTNNRRERWFAVDALNVPILPVWQTDTALGTYSEGAVILSTLVVSDTEGVPPVLTSTPLPSGLSFNTSTGVLSGTLEYLAPNAGAQVTRTFAVTARNTESGSTANASRTFTIDILNDNAAPVWETPEDLGDFYDTATLVQFTLAATDPDGAPVEIVPVSTLPNWVSFDTSTKVLTIRPPQVNTDTRFVYGFEARDTLDPTNRVRRNIGWTILNFVAPPPVWQTPENVGAFSEIRSFAFTVVAAPTDASDVTYELLRRSITTPFGTFDPATGVYSGVMPPFNNVSYSVSIRARTSNGGIQSRIFRWTALNDNAAPVWVTQANLGTFAEGTPFRATLVATDIDGVIYDDSFMIPGLVLDPNTGVLSGTLPMVTATETRNFIVAARDRLDTSALRSRTFGITIINADAAPTWVAPPAGSLGSFNESTAVAFTLVATSPSGVAYSIQSGSISGLAIDQNTGVLSGTLDSVNANTTQSIVVRAANAASPTSFALRTYSLTILNVGIPPAWQTPAGAIATYIEGAPVLTTLVATDDSLTGYEIVGGNFAASGLTFNQTTGVISGTAPRINTASSTFSLTVRASDTDGFFATRAFSILVNNSAPIWQTPTGSIGTFVEGNNVSIALGVTSAIGPVEVSVPIGALPNGFALSNTGVLTGLAYANTGVFNFTARAVDIDGTATDRAYSIRINDGAVAPRWDTLFPPGNMTSTFNLGTVAEGAQVTEFVFPQDDEEIVSVQLVAGALPNGVSVGLLGNGGISIGGRVAEDNVASGSADFNFTLRLTDNDGLTADGNFVIRVLANNAPVWTTPSASLGTFRSGAVVSSTFVAADPDGGPVSYTASGLPANLALSPTGVLSGTLTTVLSDTTSNFSIRAFDSALAYTDRNFSLRINALVAPTWVSPAALGTFAEGAAFSYQFEANDTDGTVQNYARVLGSFPAGLTLSNGGLLAGTLPTLLSGDQTFNFTLRATDNDGLVADRAFILVVDDANVAPVWVSPNAGSVGTFQSGASLALTLVATDDQPLSYSITTGTLPTGVSLNNGVLSGTFATFATPTVFNFTARASDGELSSDRAFSATVFNFAATPPQPSLWLRFDEPSGTSVTDHSGRGNVVTLLNGATRSVGPYGPQINLNGTNQSIQVTTSNGIPSGLNAPYTVATFVRFNSYAGQPTIIQYGSNSGNRTLFLLLRDCGPNVFGIHHAWWANDQVICTTETLNPDRWFHIAVTFDGSVRHVYVDGISIGSEATTGFDPIPTTNMRIGASSAGTNFLNGSIADFRIYNTALNASQVMTLSRGFQPPVWTAPLGSLGTILEGNEFGYTFVANDPDGTVASYSLAAGSIPGGLTLNSSGVLAGTIDDVVASGTQTFNFTIRATDNITLATDRTFALSVINANAIPPVWQSPAEGSIGSFTEGATIAFTLVATDLGGSIAAYSIASGSLPTGLSLTPATGRVAGTLSTVIADTTFNFVARATDVEDATADRSFALTVLNNNVAPVWTTPSGPLGSVSGGSIANFTVVATDETPVTYTVVGGTFPAGLTLNSSTGAITGTAEAVEADTEFTFTVRASDGSLFADRSFTITVLFSGVPMLQISRSIRRRTTGGGAGLNGNLTRVFTVSPTGNTRTLTYSTWLKLCTINQIKTLFSATGSDVNEIAMTATNQIVVRAAFASPAITRTFTMGTNGIEDPHAWMHVLVQINFLAGNDADRCALFLNGERVTGYTGAIADTARTALLTGSRTNQLMNVGDMMMAETIVVDGSVVAPTEFGQTNPFTGVWEPIAYTGTYGTNGFRLTYADNSSRAALGTDSSGRGNTFTVNNFEVVSTNAYFDSLLDVPSDYNPGGSPRGNYAMVDHLNPFGVSRASGLEGAGLNTDYNYWIGTMGASSGKFYYEATISTSTIVGNRIGFSTLQTLNGAAQSNPTIGIAFGQFGAYIGAGIAPISNGNVGTLAGAAPANGDVFMLAIDYDVGHIWIGRNGTWLNSGDPANNTNPYLTFTPNTMMVPSGHIAGTANFWRVNFGASGTFTHTRPTGFLPFATTNLPTPTIRQPANFINGVGYTGNGTSQTVALGFQPDIVWLKNRTLATGHVLSFDSARGADTYTEIGTNTAAIVDAQAIVSFVPTGFSIGSSSVTNNNATTYGAYGFRADPSAGIDVVTWTGDGSTSRTVAHDLGAQPHAIIMLSNAGTTDRVIYHRNRPTSQNELWALNLGANPTANSGVWNNTVPTASDFTVGSLYNANGVRYAAYVVREVPGFSRVGTYTMMGISIASPFYLGFRPRFLWWMYFDTAQAKAMGGTFSSPRFNRALNSWTLTGATAESATNHQMTFTSTGVRINNGQLARGVQVIAFAETPQKYARASR